MKKLLAFVVIGGLFALGCSGSTSSHSRSRTDTAGHVGVRTSGAAVDGEGSGKPIKPGISEKPGTSEKPDTSEKPTRTLAKLDLAPEPLTIAKGKDSGELVIKVNRDGDTGDITLMLDPPPEVKLDKNEVVIPKGKDEATVKVTVKKRDKGEVMIKVTASSAKAKETTREVSVKIEK